MIRLYLDVASSSSNRSIIYAYVISDQIRSPRPVATRSLPTTKKNAQFGENFLSAIIDETCDSEKQPRLRPVYTVFFVHRDRRRRRSEPMVNVEPAMQKKTKTISRHRQKSGSVRERVRVWYDEPTMTMTTQYGPRVAL